MRRGRSLARTPSHSRGSVYGLLRWADRAQTTDPEDPLVLYNLGCVYSNLGELDKALNVLDEAITFGMGQKEWLEHDPDLDPLRDDPRFAELLARL